MEQLQGFLGYYRLLINAIAPRMRSKGNHHGRTACFAPRLEKHSLQQGQASI